jgi:OmpA-OmpF porin, OOP family
MEVRMLKKIAFTFLISTVFAQAAMAAEDGGYIGGGLGISFTTIKNTSTGVSNTFSSSGPHLLGGYQFNRNFALEGEYFDLGSFNDYPVAIKASGYGVSGVGIIPLGSGRFSLFGKIGLTSVSTTGSAAPGWVLTVPASQTKSGVSVGFGMNYDITPKATLRLSLNSYEYAALADSVTGRAGMWGVAGVFHF